MRPLLLISRLTPASPLRWQLPGVGVPANGVPSPEPEDADPDSGPTEIYVATFCTADTDSQSCVTRSRYAYDGTRKVSGNMRGQIGKGTLSDLLDVQGLSHPQGGLMDSVHAKEPQKALIASECCSCMTMRGGAAAVASFVAGRLD